MACEITFT